MRPGTTQPAGFPGIANITDRVITRGQQIAAAAVAVVLVGVTLLALPHHVAAQGQPIPAFLPICATVWAVADLLTAYLLMSQFAVSGITIFLAAACSYALSGLLTIPYLFKFPDIFAPARSIGDQQVSVWLWLAWHLIFAAVMIACIIADPAFKRRVGNTRRLVWLGIAGVVALWSALTSATIGWRDHLPVLVVAGNFKPAFLMVLAPAVVVLNLVAAGLILLRARPATSLQVWLAIALLAAALDGLLNSFSVARYTWPWYVGKVETLFSAGAVLAMLLFEVNALYQRLAGMALFDSLTGLRNRRGFDEAFEWAAQFSRRHKKPLALLVVDVDYFKQFNDRYGHETGDVVLRRTADALLGSVLRSTDIVARYGGEEFVILLNDASPQSMEKIAERVRSSIQQLNIRHETSQSAQVVTASVGGALWDASGTMAITDLFATADRALYAAKAQGRNRYVIHPTALEAFS